MAEFATPPPFESGEIVSICSVLRTDDIMAIWSVPFVLQRKLAGTLCLLWLTTHETRAKQPKICIATISEEFSIHMLPANHPARG